MQRAFLAVSSSVVLACIVACGGGGQPNPQNNAAPVPAKGSPEKTKPDTNEGSKEPPATVDPPVSWTGKLGKGKLGKGYSAYDDIPQPWRGQFLADFKDEVATYQAHVTSAQSVATDAKSGVAKAVDERTKFEARNKQELIAKDPQFLSLLKGRNTAIEKAEAAAKGTAGVVKAAQERLDQFEQNDPPYFRKPFVGCRTIGDIEQRLNQVELEKHNEAARQAAEQARRKEEEANRQAANEFGQDGLVVFQDSLQAVRDKFSGEITGTVLNRRAKNLRYVQVTFGLYDASGAKVGTALANVAGLEAGERWNFRAVTFGKDFTSFKVAELVGY